MSEADATIVKRSYPFNESCQDYQNVFSLDPIWCSELEERMPNGSDGPVPMFVFDSDKIEEFITNMKLPGKKTKAEIQKYKSISFTAFKRGTVFTGVMTGALPYVQYQLEGTRVMAMASIKEVAQLGF